MENPSLFLRTYADWCNDPDSSFLHWLSINEFKTTTCNVYNWMWSKFCRWLETQSLTLNTVRGHDIDLFIRFTEPHSLHGYHYLRLIERIYQHINGLADSPPGSINPASLAIQQQSKKLANAPTSFMATYLRNDLQHLIEHGQLPHAYSTVKRIPTTPNRLTGKAGEWKRQRDLALAAIFLGAGLRVQEACALTISCISENVTSLVIPVSTNVPDGQDSIYSRTIPLEPFVTIALKRWLHVRNESTYGDYVFAANTKGKAMDPSSMFRRIRIIFAEMGITEFEGRACCQTLRNAYIATLFDLNTELTTIAERAGFVELTTVSKLQKEYLAFFDRLANLKTI